MPWVLQMATRELKGEVTLREGTGWTREDQRTARGKMGTSEAATNKTRG